MEFQDLLQYDTFEEFKKGKWWFRKEVQIELGQIESAVFIIALVLYAILV